MNRLGVALAATALVVMAAAPESGARRRGPKLGVFGTVNGKNFKATNIAGADDPCVNGIFKPTEGIIVFGALECRGRRRRQGTAVKRNYKALLMGCGKFESTDTSTYPYVVPCASSGYVETKTGRFGIPLSMTEWGVTFALVDLVPTSSVNMRIEAFDGTTVRGAIYGTFDQPLQGAGSSVPAPISGEVRFEFPFKIQ